MIFLSAGHHDKDPGAVSGKYIERDLTKESRSLIEMYIDPKQLIKDKDFETNTQYQSRIKPGSGSVVFDLHFNAGSSTATGTECYVNAKDFADKKSMSYKMAEEICEATSEILVIPNRGVKSEGQSQHSRIGILNKNAGCAVLWEICFISNPLNMSAYTFKKAELSRKIAEILVKYDALK
ncbi:N-acetylmuramoyl-L-alanine amidase [Chryseobacterium sp. 2R14A]|uniref:N-acetylmuramoyl-L-alanine amidase n=1 Tax=Chryseobacterium sp. 2R14A TaxID=3380353 RepID=UPI003CFABA79